MRPWQACTLLRGDRTRALSQVQVVRYYRRLTAHPMVKVVL